MQEFYPNDRSAYVLYEVIAEASLPAVFHTGHSGIGTGMRGGGGVLLISILIWCLLILRRLAKEVERPENCGDDECGD